MPLQQLRRALRVSCVVRLSSLSWLPAGVTAIGFVVGQDLGMRIGDEDEKTNESGGVLDPTLLSLG